MGQPTGCTYGISTHPLREALVTGLPASACLLTLATLALHPHSHSTSSVSKTTHFGDAAAFPQVEGPSALRSGCGDQGGDRGVLHWEHSKTPGSRHRVTLPVCRALEVHSVSG